MERSSRTVVTGLSMLALAACSSTSSTIAGKDDAFFPGARLSLPFRKGGGALELDLADSSGAFEQRLDAGETVRLENVTFSGPGIVAVDHDLARAYGGARATFTEENGLGAALLVGLGFTQLDAVAEMGGVKDDVSVSALGLIGGLEAFYRFHERAKVFAEVSFLPSVAAGYSDVDLTSIDLGVAFAPWDHVELAAAWRSWRYKAEASGVDSDLDLELRGPHVSLRITP